MLLSDSDRSRLEEELSRRLTGGVDIELAVDDSPASRQAVELLEELSGLSDLLTYRAGESSETDACLPSLVVSGAALGEVRFTGLPTGYEFPTFIDAVIAVSTGEVGLSPASRERVEALAADRHLLVFTTPT